MANFLEPDETLNPILVEEGGGGVVVAAYLITPVGGHWIIAGRVGFGNIDDNGNDEGDVENVACGLE